MPSLSSPSLWQAAAKWPDTEWVQEKLSRIKCIATDVDGVLTQGDLTFTSQDDELKAFNVKDGQGLALLGMIGFKVAIITARSSPIIEKRAAELKIPHVFMGAKNKSAALDELLAQLGLASDQVAYVGDDLPDIAVLKRVGFAACPADAVADVKRVSHYITTLPGGQGCMREVINMLVDAQNH